MSSKIVKKHSTLCRATKLRSEVTKN